jgi:hypothetical protein
MLIVALVLAVIGLAALVTAVVTSNELIAWVCIAASVIGVLLLIVDALRERSRGSAPADATDEPEPDVVGPESEFDADYPEDPEDPEDPAVEEPTAEEPAVEEHTVDEHVDEHTVDEPAVEEPTESKDEHQR